MTEQRYELYDKYSPNDLIQDNYNVIDGFVQIYGAESVECELNDLFNRLRDINSICDDCLKIKNKNDVGYYEGITEIKKIIEDSVSEINDMKWWEIKE